MTAAANLLCTTKYDKKQHTSNNLLTQSNVQCIILKTIAIVNVKKICACVCEGRGGGVEKISQKVANNHFARRK